MCTLLKEGGLVLGTFRSERMRVLYRSRQDDHLRVMLVLVHIDITPPHTPLLVFRRICEQRIPYSWRAFAFVVDRWHHDCGARRVWFISRPGSPMQRKEGSFWVPSVLNGCEYFTDHAKTIVFA
ncbi:uncharacterized protein TNCV_3339341 [Trichonephila clavipes]|nr:uncharacterized protein TNCV_3339341 [Trichonephila clavipes]